MTENKTNSEIYFFDVAEKKKKSMFYIDFFEELQAISY
jgi:hypothetical protein